MKMPWCWLPAAVDIWKTMLIRDVAWETCQWMPVAPPETWRRSITKFRTERKLQRASGTHCEVQRGDAQVVLVHVVLRTASKIGVRVCQRQRGSERMFVAVNVYAYR